MRPVFVVCVLCTISLRAVDSRAQSTWTSTTGGAWNDPAHWDMGVPDGIGARAVIGPTFPSQASTITLPIPIDLSSLVYSNTSNVVISGSGPLRFVETGDTEAILHYLSGIGLQINAPIEILADALALRVNGGTGNQWTIGGSLSGPGHLRKLENGTVTLSGDTSLHTGDIEVVDGTLIASPLAAGSSSGRFVVSNSGNLTIQTGPVASTVAKPLAIDGRTVSFIANSGATQARVDSPIEISGQAILRVDANVTANLYGSISGAGDLTIGTSATGTQNAVLFNIYGDNSYDGVTVIDVGPRTTLRQVSVQSSTGLGSAIGHTVVRSRVGVYAGSAENFVVERTGELAITPSATAHAGDVTLMGSILNPTTAFSSDATIEMSGSLHLSGGGQIGVSGSVTNPLNLAGNVDGTGSLVIEGGGPLRFFGEVANDGDLIVGSRAVVELIGPINNAGDLYLMTGSSEPTFGLAATWKSTTSQLDGDIYIRDRALTVATDLELDNLLLDARRPGQPSNQSPSSIIINSGANATLRGELAFRGGSIQGSLGGVEEYHKTTVVNGRLADIGANFDGAVYVHEGLLAVGAGGLGSSAGGAHVLRSDRAALLIDATTVQDDIYLNNGRGFEYSGALVGTGTVLGDVFLGENGAYVGGGGGRQVSLTGSFGSDLILAGSIHGGDLYKGPRGRLTIVSGDHTYMGRTEVLDGELILKDQAHLGSTSEIVLRRTDQRVEVRLDDRSQISTDRIADSINWRSRGDNRIFLFGRTGGATTEAIGNVNIELGQLRFEIFAGTSGGEATLDIASISRERGTTVQFLLDSDRAKVQLGTAPTTNDIMPWAIFGQDFYSRDLAAIGMGSIVVPLGTVQAYVNDISTAAASENVNLIANASLAANKSINVLRLGASDPTLVLDLGGHQLTVESGAIVNATPFPEIKNGQLTSGTDELIIHGFEKPGISASLVDNGEDAVMVTFSNGPTRLSGVNTYSGGTTIVGNGQVDIEGSQSLPVGGDVTLSSGQLHLSNSPAGAWKIGTLRMAGEGIRPLSGATGAIEAEDYQLEYGFLEVPIVGAGTITKRGEGRVRLQSPSTQYTGQIVIEQGILEATHSQSLGTGASDEAHGTIVKRGGALEAKGTFSSERLILDGGDLLGSGTWSGPIEVRDHSRILVPGDEGTLTVTGQITGTGDLTVSGAFGQGPLLALNSPLNAFQGNLRLTGGRVSLGGGTGRFPYSGQIFVDAADFRISNPQALANATVTILEAGQFRFGPATTGKLIVQGGTLALDEGATTLAGQLRFEESSQINTAGADLNVHTTARSATISSETRFADQSRLKKFGRGNVTFQGRTYLEGTTELVAFDGLLDVRGTLVAAGSNSILNLVGNAAQLHGSLEVPAGNSFQLQYNGAVADLVLDAKSILSGGGTIASNVTLGPSSVIAPGDSPGQLTIDGDLRLGPLNTFRWELGQATGTPGMNWDILQIGGQAMFAEASPLRLQIMNTAALLQLDNLLANSGLQSTQWRFLASAELVNFNSDSVQIEPPMLGPIGRFSVIQDQENLYLTYTIPEPTSVALVAVALLVATSRRSRRLPRRREP